MTTSDYLTQLQQDREDLVDNLEAKGITGLTGDETFTELVPEVLNIPSGGGGDNAYDVTSYPGYIGCRFKNIIKKLENIKMTSTLTSAESLFDGFNGTVLTFNNETDTSNVTNMRNMFNACPNLTELDLSMFNTSKVTNMQNMFYSCSAITKLNLSSFNTSIVTDISGMFNRCSLLNHLDIRNFTFDSVTTSNYMMYDVPTNCEIIVKSQTEKDWFATNFSSYTNVKTVAEYEAEHIVIRLPLDTIESAGDGGVLFDSTHTHGISEWAEAITIINSVDVNDTLLFTLYDTDNNLKYTYLGYKSSNNVFIFGNNEEYNGDVGILKAFMFDSYRIVISDNKYNVYFESSHMTG